jgi:hypothetical protein
LLLSTEQVNHDHNDHWSTSLLRHSEFLRVVWSDGNRNAPERHPIRKNDIIWPVIAGPFRKAAFCRLLEPRSLLALRTKLRRVDILVPVLSSTALVRALAALPALESLSLARVDPFKLALLAADGPPLTELRLGYAPDRHEATRMVHSLQRFKHLRSLLLTQADLYEGRFRELFGHPNLAQLCELSLCHWDVVASAAHGAYVGPQVGRSIPLEELRQGLSAMVYLESLHLRMVRCVGRMLEALLIARPSPPLCRLLIEVSDECTSPLFLPEPPLLSTLMAYASALHATLILPEPMTSSHKGDRLRDAIVNDISALRRAAATMPRVRIVPPSSIIDVWTV